MGRRNPSDILPEMQDKFMNKSTDQPTSYCGDLSNNDYCKFQKDSWNGKEF